MPVGDVVCVHPGTVCVRTKNGVHARGRCSCIPWLICVGAIGSVREDQAGRARLRRVSFVGAGESKRVPFT